MKVVIVDRKYPIGKWFRIQKMKGAYLVIGFKIVLYRYEIRFYNNSPLNS